VLHMSNIHVVGYGWWPPVCAALTVRRAAGRIP
jgi:hypothetical protein